MKEQKRNKEFDKKIIECIQKNYSVFAWKSLNGVIEKCEMRAVAFRSDYNEIELEARDGSDKYLENIMGGNRLVSIYIPEMAVTFQAPLKNIFDGKKIKLEIPEEFSIHERRKHERVMPRKKSYVTIEVNKQLYKKAIYDISLGGFAIILPKIEKLGIQQDSEISSVVLHLEGEKEKIESKARCTSCFVFDRFKFSDLPYGGQKISFCFKDMSEEHKKRVQEYVVSELLAQEVYKKAK